MNPRLVSVLFLFLRATLAYSTPPLETCSPDTSPLKPYLFPIILSGNLPIVGENIRELIALKWHAGRWQQIDLQIDQRNAKDEYVLADGLPFTAGTDDFVFDANDELVLRGRDLGEGFSHQQLKHASGQLWLKKSRGSWRVDICQNGLFRGSALLLAMSGSTVAFQKDADVQFDEAKKSVLTRRYRYDFHATKAALLGHIYLRNAKQEMEAIAGSSFMMIAKLPWYLPDIHLDENSFHSEIESWQTGPIRSIIAVGVKFKNLLSILNLHMFSELVFYENFFQIPSEIHFPFDASRLLKPGSGLVYAIKFWKPNDWQVETNMSRLPAQSPQWVIEHAKELSPQKIYFARGEHQSRQWRFVTRVRVDQRAVEAFPPPLLLQGSDFEDENIAKFWPWTRDLKGDWGVFLDLSKVNRGVYDFGLDLVLASEAYQELTDYDSARAFWHPYLDGK